MDSSDNEAVNNKAKSSKDGQQPSRKRKVRINSLQLVQGQSSGEKKKCTIVIPRTKGVEMELN